MAANFQHNMGVQGMMPQQQRQQQQQQQQQQQRPQQQGATNQIQTMIFNTINSQTGPLTGWQAGVLPNERMGLIFNIIGNLRLASQHQPNPPGLQRMIEIGLRFEKDIFDKSPNKETYKHEVAQKLDQLLERRNQNQASLQQQINQQAQNQAQNQQALMAQQSQQAQQMMLNQQNGMQAQGQRPMPQQQNQQPFSHLQHQMQASPLPGQQTPQAPMGMPNQGMQQNLTQNQQQQFQANLEQQRLQQQNAAGRPGGGQPQMSAQDNAAIAELAHKLSMSQSEEEKSTIRAGLASRMDPATLNKYQAQGQDPITFYYRSQAVAQLKRLRMNQQMAMNQQAQNMSSAATPMQPQRPINPSPLPGQIHPSAPMVGNPDFGSFMGNMENTAAQQQQQGVIAEQAGQMVVPVSNGARNATPQPGVMAGPPTNLNDQRNLTNPNLRAQQQQQQMLHAQQMQQQQQRLQQNIQQQSQVQARLSAQTKVQSMGLQGQPGGMGPGPVPPQQSPAMATLNAPMRTPSQQMNHPEPSQVNPATANFGAPLDPRFMQGNQRQLGPGNVIGINPAMFSNMSPEKQQQIASLPPDKLQDVVNKWNESRAQAMGAHMQNGRPQMPMQGNALARPGQPMPQPGQFNPQAAANQFAAQNGGQRGPPPMVNGMNQAQQLVLNQQMANMRQNQMQQRGMPMGQEQQQLAFQQMDNVPIPPALYGHANMPPGIPPEVKKWGQLKHWIAQNAQNLGLPATTLDSVKQLQTMHYRNILTMKNRQQQQMQGGNMQSGPQGVQNGNTIPPGMSAPVAPMGPNPMQMQSGMNMAVPGQIRQPTPQEIQNFRNHMGGKLAGATDDQIRVLYMRNMQGPQAQQQSQMTPQQQAHRAQMMQQMQLQRMQQANAQQIQQSGQPQPHQIAQPQSKPATVAPPKQTQPATEPAPPSTTNANAARAPRSQPSAKNQAQNSSPAQPAKNLKRASSSDDVVEVPNPNTQQARPAPATAQTANQPSQMRLPLTPAQLASLNPEQRKKYEHMLQLQQPQDRLKTINKEERDNFHDSPDIPMDEATKKHTASRILQIMPPLGNVGKILPKWFQITSNEETARQYYRLRLRIMRQFKDNEMKTFKDNFSITAQEVDSARNMMNTMVKDLSTRFPEMMKPDSTKSQTAASQPAQSAAPPTPLNAANLQQQQQQFTGKSHQRSNSRSSHPPAAPTSSHAPFQFGAPSPHGLPAYGGNSKITQENLHIPARKKQKQNGTPGSNASPQVTKAVSPEIKRQAEPRPQFKASLVCPEPDCDRHSVGFETEEALKTHTLEEHIRPLEDSASFVKENLALALGLDSQGRPKNKPPASQQAPPTAGTMMVPNGSKQGQTPHFKADPGSAATTPMNRQVSMNRQGSAAGGKPSKSSLAQDASAKLQSVQKEVKAPIQQETINLDPWANSGIDPNEFLNSFAPFETGAGGAISDMNVYRSITPNDTPESSKDGVSEPNSDISEGVGLEINLDLFDDNWQPFGPSDTDNLFDTNGYNFSGGDEDLTMFDDEPAIVNYQWDDMIDPAAFDKPFVFDTSFYSMKAE